MANTEKGNLPAPTVGELILYQTQDGQTRLQVRLEGETAWLTQAQMGELFQTTKQSVSLHIQNMFTGAEITPLPEGLKTVRETCKKPGRRIKGVTTEDYYPVR